MTNMKTSKSTRFFPVVLFFALCSITTTMWAQEITYADKWAKQQTNRYVSELELTEDQAVKVHEILLTTAKKAEEIKETQTGEEQKKAIWRNNSERNKLLQALFTPEQQKKFKEMTGGGNQNVAKKADNTNKKTDNAEEAYRKRWVEQRVEYYTSNLDLSAKQAQQFYEILLSTSEKAAEIKETQQGDAQKKALWRNNRDRKEMLLDVLDKKQKNKFNELK